MKRFLMCFVSVLVFVSVAALQSVSAESGKPEAGEPQPVSGKVVETMNSGGYTYVLLEKGGKKTWVAVTEMKVTKGQDMSFKPGSEMQNFESTTLKRKFDRIVFSEGPVGGKGSVDGQTTTGSKGKVVAPAEKIRVEKAAGQSAYTVAEIYRNRGKLDKKPVVVKGKVIKVSTGIMGKNWIHLQDGSGDPKKGTHNLVATSQEVPAVGDVVTVSGTLYKDKDFGSGYKYDVLVEDASITK